VSYSFPAVREETAQLAALAFSDAGESRNNTPSRSRTASVPNNHGLNHGKSDDQKENQPEFVGRSSGQYIKQPPAIQEVSEPASPENTHSVSPRVKPKRSNISEITKLFHSQQEPEQEAGPSGSSRGGDSVRSDIPELVIEESEDMDENTPLMRKTVDYEAIHKGNPNGPGDLEGQPVRRRKGRLQELQTIASTVRQKSRSCFYTVSHPKSWDAKTIWERGVKEPVGLLPCVFLGVLLNVLDALSYGKLSAAES
jgi:SulP family sulfate permease